MARRRCVSLLHHHPVHQRRIGHAQVQLIHARRQPAHVGFATTDWPGPAARATRPTVCPRIFVNSAEVGAAVPAGSGNTMRKLPEAGLGYTWSWPANACTGLVASGLAPLNSSAKRPGAVVPARLKV